jgi:hypothetical protein
MKIYYRISDGEDKGKEKLPYATKQYCLENFIRVFPNEEITVYADNVKDSTFQWLLGMQIGHTWKLKRTQGGSSAAGFRIVLEDAISLPDDEIIYFVEEDYLHLSNSRNVILEGLEHVDYVSLYDHPDKYIPFNMGGNPLIGDDGAELTKVFVSNSTHWKITNSTTMTFATSIKTLKEDEHIWKKYSTGNIPNDYEAFMELRNNGRSLATPIPSYSTHCEVKWTAPLIDWARA